MKAMDIIFVLVPCDLKLTLAVAGQSEAIFQKFEKYTYFATSEAGIWGHKGQ